MGDQVCCAVSLTTAAMDMLATVPFFLPDFPFFIFPAAPFNQFKKLGSGQYSTVVMPFIFSYILRPKAEHFEHNLWPYDQIQYLSRPPSEYRYTVSIRFDGN